MIRVLASKELAVGPVPEFGRYKDEVKLVRASLSHELYMYHSRVLLHSHSWQ
jgi:hypothetical protein